MATVFKKTFTKPLPTDAERFTRKGEPFARWTDAKGKTRLAKVTTGKDGSPRLLIEAGTFTGKYRDGSGDVREVATGCRDETAARQVLADLVKRAENVKSGLITPAQDAVINQQGTVLSEHIIAYIAYLAAKSASAQHRRDTERCIRRLAADCSLTRLADLSRPAIERWLAARTGEGMSARSRNAYRAAIVAFCNWCVSTRRLVANPLAGTPKADERADQRRHRRALTEAELVKLLDVARRRPLLDAATVRRGAHKGELAARVKPEVAARLDTLGRERALIYKTLVLTGLRKGELASLTVGQLELDGAAPSALLHAADEKNRRGCRIPLRLDLAADLRGWLADRLTAAQVAARQRGEAIPARLPDKTPLFRVPALLVRILDRDLAAAGLARKVKDEKGKVRIDKRDGRGWTVDVHALRTTFGTLLSKGGVSLRTAQAAMRHSDPALTANVYTDPRLLDVAGAMDALPKLPLGDRPQSEQQRLTGTYAAGPLAPTLAPNTDDLRARRTVADKANGGASRAAGSLAASQVPVMAQQRRPLPFADNGRRETGELGFEPRLTDPESVVLPLHYSPVLLPVGKRPGGRRTTA